MQEVFGLEQFQLFDETHQEEKDCWGKRDCLSFLPWGEEKQVSWAETVHAYEPISLDGQNNV